MAITAKNLLRLHATLAGRRALPYDAGLIPACFNYGMFLAYGRIDLPDWLTTALSWARTAVAVGQASASRVIQLDQRSAVVAS
jgi:TPR repeat protein